MKVSLVVTQGANQGKEIPVTVFPFLIGRDPLCHLRPASGTISRRHCALVVRQDQLFINDYGSTNGTIVNGQRVRGELELKDGDQLQIDPLLFGVQIQVNVPVDKRTPMPKQRVPDEALDDEAIAALLLDIQDNINPDPLGFGSDSGRRAQPANDGTAHEVRPLPETKIHPKFKPADPKR